MWGFTNSMYTIHPGVGNWIKLLSCVRSDIRYESYIFGTVSLCQIWHRYIRYDTVLLDKKTCTCMYLYHTVVTDLDLYQNWYNRSDHHTCIGSDGCLTCRNMDLGVYACVCRFPAPYDINSLCKWWTHLDHWHTIAINLNLLLSLYLGLIKTELISC